MTEIHTVRRKRAINNHAARSNFVVFVLRVFQTISPGVAYVHGQYIQQSPTGWSNVAPANAGG